MCLFAHFKLQRCPLSLSMLSRLLTFKPSRMQEGFPIGASPRPDVVYLVMPRIVRTKLKSISSKCRDGQCEDKLLPKWAPPPPCSMANGMAQRSIGCYRQFLNPSASVKREGLLSGKRQVHLDQSKQKRNHSDAVGKLQKSIQPTLRLVCLSPDT